MAAEACTKLSKSSTCWRFRIVAIDEGQFFPDLLDFCDSVANTGKIVIVAALDTDYLRRPFGDIIQLVPRAELITKLSAVCSRAAMPLHIAHGCGSPAESNRWLQCTSPYAVRAT